MSGFENHGEELASPDHETVHYAAICGVDLADHAAIHAGIDAAHETGGDDKARETLGGLLMLRMKIETEVIEQGMTPGELKGW